MYLDDIMIMEAMEKEHLQKLGTVLTRLENAGLQLKLDECAFLLPAVEYLRNMISTQGLQSGSEP